MLCLAVAGQSFSVALSGFAVADAKAMAIRAIEGSEVQIPSPINDGSKVLDQVTNHVRQMGAYKFDGYLGTLKEKKGLTVNTGSFIFKPTSLLRVEVKDGGFKSGSVLVKKKDGSVRAKGGPALLGMKMNLEPDSNMLTLPNGLNILQCDMLSLLHGLKSGGQKIYASDAPVQLNSSQVFVLEAREQGQTPTQRVFVDKDQMIPVEWLLYRNGKVFSTVKFNNFQPLPNLEENLFEL